VRAGEGLQEERKFGKGTQLITVTVKDAKGGRKFGKGSQFIRITSQHNQIGRKRRKYRQPQLGKIQSFVPALLDAL
jgi:hypothetical protein